MNPGVAPVEFNGGQTANWLHALKTPHPFIVNMHGITEDVSSWVLTKAELTHLFDTPGYDEFIVSCLSTRTVLFLGISADDVAVGGHLERIANRRIDTGTHYWLTDRTDAATDQWAERVGISAIRYDATENDHSAIAEFFADVLSFLPTDEVPAPVTLPVAPVTALLPPKELRREDAETIRKILNARAAEILQLGTEESYAEYERFCRQYNEAVYRAWYVDLEEGENNLLGYQLLERAGGGAFGTVYRATTLDGEMVAVKILHEEVRKTPEMLQSFRRGVNSMRILSNANLAGIVRYRAASEIPAFVVMDWVEGPNLRQVIQARQLDNWPEILQVAHSLAKIIRSAHMLPERVLHRDLRPANIMLENYWTDPSSWNLIVLDFDLSYHIGSKEKTIDLRGDTATGYLAPEQLQKLPGVSTRNAAVDSFGLGMTLYFLVSQRDPLPAEHMHAKWSETVYSACRLRDYESWVSLPERIARVIQQCTCNQQAERWDLAQVENELWRLKGILNSPEEIPSAELVAEELVARSVGLGLYKWIDDRLEARIELASGLVISVAANEAHGIINLELNWSSSGLENRRTVGRWLPEATRYVSDALKVSGWRVNVTSKTGQVAHLVASIDVREVFNNLPRAASTLTTVAQRMTFK
jgi:serine/threonine protein kinase